MEAATATTIGIRESGPKGEYMGDVPVQDGLDAYFSFYFCSSGRRGSSFRSSLHYLRGLYQNDWRMDLDFTVRGFAYCAIGFYFATFRVASRQNS
jgi:hypothetical protein